MSSSPSSSDGFRLWPFFSAASNLSPSSKGLLRAMTVARFSHCASRCSLFSLVSVSLTLPLASGGSKGAGVFWGASPRSSGRCELLSALDRPLGLPKCSRSESLRSALGRTGKVEGMSSKRLGRELVLALETRPALLLRKILRRFFSAGTWSDEMEISSPGYEGGTMTSCS